VNVLPESVMVMAPAYDDEVPNEPLTVRFPPLVAMVVAPEYVLAPESVSVLLPALMMPPVPLITPLNPVLPDEPEVSTPDPSVMLPAPVIEPTVSDTPLRSNVPVTETAEPSGTEPDPLRRSVPAVTVVAPV
jgi:hypothetical protein